MRATPQLAFFGRELSEAEAQTLRENPPTSTAWHIATKAADTFPTELLADAPEAVERLRWDGPVDDVLLASVLTSNRFEALNFPDFRSDARGLRSVLSSEHLRSLRLGVSEGMELEWPGEEETVPPLTHVHLIGYRVGPEDLERIGKIESLRSLYLDGNGIDEDALSDMVRARPEIHVHFNDWHPTGETDSRE